jgi:hypothetical protein
MSWEEHRPDAGLGGGLGWAIIFGLWVVLRRAGDVPVGIPGQKQRSLPFSTAHFRSCPK